MAKPTPVILSTPPKASKPKATPALKAPASEPSVRNARGWLGQACILALNTWLTEDSKGKFITPHNLAQRITSPQGATPSAGAVSAVLDRWQTIGFARTNEKPFGFIDYTAAGKRDGLTLTDEKWRAAQKKAKAAAA